VRVPRRHRPASEGRLFVKPLDVEARARLIGRLFRTRGFRGVDDACSRPLSVRGLSRPGFRSSVSVFGGPAARILANEGSRPAPADAGRRRAEPDARAQSELYSTTRCYGVAKLAVLVLADRAPRPWRKAAAPAGVSFRTPYMWSLGCAEQRSPANIPRNPSPARPRNRATRHEKIEHYGLRPPKHQLLVSPDLRRFLDRIVRRRECAPVMEIDTGHDPTLGKGSSRLGSPR